MDLMATGFPHAHPGSSERERAVALVENTVKGIGYQVRRETADAGLTLRMSYLNSLGTRDQMKIDLDLLNRITLMPPALRTGPAIFHADDFTFPVVAEDELVGQKLTAVAYRAAPRDLFDMYLIINAKWQQKPRSRSMYLAYSFLSDAEWYRLDYPVRLNVDYGPDKLEDVLRTTDGAPSLKQIKEAATVGLEKQEPSFIRATRENQFLRKRLLKGERNAFAMIAGETDERRAKLLEVHPGLVWRLSQARQSSASEKT